MKKSAKNAMWISVIFLVFLTGTNANATFFSGSVTGEWGDVISTDPSDVYSINNRDDLGFFIFDGVAQFNWGTPTTWLGDDNQFTFDGVGSDWGEADWEAEEGIAFLLGDFTYQNESTNHSQGVDGVDLDLTISLTSPEYLDFTFTGLGFSITNTPNTTGNPFLDGDIVTLVAGTEGNTFSYNGTEYTFDIVGFSDDSGQTFTYDFSSPEGGMVSAGLYGKISETGGGGAQVPEPATIFLMGTGLLGLFGYRKKFWKYKD